MTQLNAINEIIDYVRTLEGSYSAAPSARIPRVRRALKVLEARAEILRARAQHNRAARSKHKVHKVHAVHKVHPVNKVRYKVRVVRKPDGSLHWED